jgi:hypothetical protein
MTNRTCGQCIRLESDDGSTYCRPPSTKWQKGEPVMMAVGKDEPADECECFERFSGEIELLRTFESDIREAAACNRSEEMESYMLYAIEVLDKGEAK